MKQCFVLLSLIYSGYLGAFPSLDCIERARIVFNCQIGEGEYSAACQIKYGKDTHNDIWDQAPRCYYNLNCGGTNISGTTKPYTTCEVSAAQNWELWNLCSIMGYINSNWVSRLSILFGPSFWGGLFRLQAGIELRIRLPSETT